MGVQEDLWRSATPHDDSLSLAPITGARPAEHPISSGPPDAYTFLRDSGVSTADLIDAAETARQWNVSLSAAMLARGDLDETSYAQLVANALALPVVNTLEMNRETPIAWVGHYPVRRVHQSIGSRPTYALPAASVPFAQLRQLRDDLIAAGKAVVVVAPSKIAAAVERADRRMALRSATFDLRNAKPQFSAGIPMPFRQVLTLQIFACIFIGGFLVAPGYAVAALLALLSIVFTGVVLVRLSALKAVLSRPRRKAPLTILDAELPRYTIMVPLFEEAAVIDGLVASLSQLQYPAAKLEIMLVLEEVDLATKIALLQPKLPPTFQIVVVPDGQPRTKPKALNYALHFATGDMVVVFDAEDRPEPDQLLRAVAAFRDGPPNLGCVQAQLNLYNPKDSWYARQFTIEYSALFDAILPALEALKLPLPLGGTSNHFPRALLQSIGGWDPFNVTEDADLGMRLARLGYATQVLDSTTWEEAPITWAQWLPQRTRWLKGWYQTYLVHMRHPLQLVRELGLWKFFGFQLFMGGIILSTLVHPLFYVLIAWSWATADTSYEVPAVWSGVLLWVSVATVALGYGSAILVGLIASRRRRHKLFWSVVLMPVCWLLISYASYRALWKFWREPFHWEKTAHGKTRRSARKTRHMVPQPRDSR